MLELTLTNIGCWKSKHVTFTDNALVLVSGRTGIGKSTLFRAIQFALTGQGRKLAADGAKTYKVELVFRGVRVVRTKSTRVTVTTPDGLVLEDDAAQGYMDAFFGDMALAYMEQKGRDAFVTMTPQNRLEYLERIAFADVPLLQYRDRLKVREQDLKRTEDQLTTARATLKTSLESAPTPTLEIPPETDLSALYDDVQLQMTDCIATSVRLSAELDAGKTQLEMARAREQVRIAQMQELSIAETELKHCRADVDRTRGILDSMHMDEDSYKVRLQGCDAWDALDACTASIAACAADQIRVEAEQSANDAAYADALATYKQVSYTGDELRTLHSHATARDRIDRGCAALVAKYGAMAKLTEAIEALELQLRCQLKTCPGCGLDLLQDACGTLRPCDAHTRTILEAGTGSEADYTQMTRDLAQWQNYEAEAAALPEINSSVAEIEQWMRKLQSSKTTLRHLRDQRQKLTATFADIQERRCALQETERTCKEATLYVDRESRAVLRQTLTQYHAREERYEALQFELRKRKSRVERISSALAEFEAETASIPALETAIAGLYAAIQTTTETQSALRTRLSDIAAMQNLEKLRAQMADICKELKQIQTDQYVLDVFRKLFRQAETKTMDTFIGTLNAHIQMYLDVFFPDAPISVALVDRVTGKAGKSQLDFEIVSQGISMDLTMLSGGEYDRVVLAVMLGLLETSQCPLVLLDEVVSSLDQETASVVCACLGEHLRNRCVVLIAHQIITGTFDQVVHCDKFLDAFLHFTPAPNFFLI